MKKILFSLFFILVFLIGKGQDIAPTDSSYHNLTTYAFRYDTADSSVYIYKGAKYKTSKLARAKDGWFAKALDGTDTVYIHVEAKDTLDIAKYMLHNDSINLAGYFTNWKALQYRKLNNHDSLSTLDEKQHASLTNVLGRGSYHVSLAARDSINSSRQMGDTVRNVGSATVYDVSLKQNTLTNPYTGTGSAGQVAFHTGTSSLSGDNGLFWDNTNKRLGIGSTTPEEKLELYDATASIATRTALKIRDMAQSGSNEYALTKIGMYGATNFEAAYLGYIHNQGNNQNYAALTFGVIGIEKMRIDQNGDVSIGAISSGGYKLYTNGTGYFTNQITLPLSTGTSPFVITSTTLNTNLNADLLDGQHGTYYEIAGTAATHAALTTTAHGISNYLPLAGGTMTGNINSTNNAIFTGTGRGSNYQYADMTNTGGRLAMGIENSTGNYAFSGSLPYSTNFGSANNTALHLFANSLTWVTLFPNGNFHVGYTIDQGYTAAINGAGFFATSLTTPTINLTTDAVVNYFWKCTNSTTGAGAWASVSESQFYNGAWDANANSPSLADGGGAPQGTYYHCIVSGTVDFDGAGGRAAIAFTQYIDDVAYNGSIWEKVPNAQYALLVMSSSILGGSKLGSGMEVGNEAADMLNIKNEDKGDITVSGSGSSSGRIWTIDAEAVTYAKMQHVSATDKVLGRVTAGAGDVEEISTTGSGYVVRATSPTIVTPIISGTLTIGTSGGQQIDFINANNGISYNANQFQFNTNQTQGFVFNNLMYVNGIITTVGTGTSTDWNAKQAALSGTGFVKISGSTISYDNSTYQPLATVLTNIQDTLNLHEHLANKVTSISGASTNAQYPSAKLLSDQLLLKLAVADSANGSGAAGKWASGKQLNTHAALTTTAHGLGASAFHADNYFQAAGTYSTDIHSNITALNAVTNTNTGDQTSVTGNAGTVTVANDNTTNADYYPMWATGAGSIAPKISSPALTYNPYYKLLTINGGGISADHMGVNTYLSFGASSQINLNGAVGTSGQVLTSGGAGAMTWTTPSGGGGAGMVTSVAMTVPTGLSISGTPITTSGTLALSLTSGYVIPTTTNISNLNTAYDDRLKWDGGSTGLTASTGRTSLGLGELATTNITVQSLSGTTPTWNVNSGINATLTLSGNTTITLSNLVAGTSGNIEVINGSSAYTLTFAGYTNEIHPSIYSAANVVLTSGGSAKHDNYSWWYLGSGNGSRLKWNGGLDYK